MKSRAQKAKYLIKPGY